LSGHHGHHHFSARHIVAKALEFLGLLGETISFLLILHENEERFYNKAYVATFFLLVLCVLIHHYFNQSNLERIEDMHEAELEELGYSSKWIKHSKIEDVLRIVIFVIFAVISGAITYIIIVGIEAYSITESLNLHLFSKFYVTAYMGLYFVLLAWHTGGIIADKRVYLKPGKSTNQRITFPSRIFPNALISSFVSDVLGFFVWICFFMMIVVEKWWVTNVLWFFAAAYILVILLRLGRHVAERLKMKPPRYVRHTIAAVVITFAALNFVVYKYYQMTRPMHNDIMEKLATGQEPLVIAMEEDSIPMYYMRFDTSGGHSRYIATGFGYELARMLAGLGESDTARAHARELLAAARDQSD
jgi:hypothetical protein